MASDSGRTIQFTVETPEQKALLEEYAKSRGFSRVSELTRAALYEFISRRPARSGSTIDAQIRDALGFG